MRGRGLAAGTGQRLIEPPLGAAPATVEPRQPAIGMAQRPERRRDARDRRQMLAPRAAPGLAQRRRRPGQQGEDLEQVFGVAGRDAALVIDLALAVARQGLRGGADMALHPGQRQAGIDQPGQRLDPRQAGAGGFPAPRQKHRLTPEAAEIGAGVGPVAAIEQQDRVIDQPDHPTAGQVRGPSRPAAAPVAADPAKGPVLRAGPCRGIGDRGQIVEPEKPVQFLVKARIGRGQVPKPGLGRGDQETREQEIAADQLAAAGKAADRLRLGLADETARRARQRRQPGMQAVHHARIATGTVVGSRHACRSLFRPSPVLRHRRAGIAGLGPPEILPGQRLPAPPAPVTGKCRCPAPFIRAGAGRR